MDTKIMHRLSHLIFQTILKSNIIGSFIFSDNKTKAEKGKVT